MPCDEVILAFFYSIMNIFTTLKQDTTRNTSASDNTFGRHYNQLVDTNQSCEPDDCH